MSDNMVNENMRSLTDEDLDQVAGGKKVTYVCQACGEMFKDKAGKVWKGEPVCPECKRGKK